MSTHKICVVSGSRADYGLLYWPMKSIEGDKDLDLQIVATGMHLSKQFGNTYKIFEDDGFRIDAKVDIGISGDTSVAITKSLGNGIIGFSETLDHLKPDILMVLGDRYEIFSAVQAALLMRIPVAHICGGDITEGAYDDAIRHSITKMSHIHFVTNEDAVKRIKQMGENPEHIQNVGSPGIDRIKRMKFLSRDKFFKTIEFTPRLKNIIVTFHPVTLDSEASTKQIDELFSALTDLGQNIGIIMTGSNADTEGISLNRKIEEFAKDKDNVFFSMSLGQELYLNALKHVDAVVGNSSSGLYEAPSFGVATVNIGDRQKGRLQAKSVINCPPEKKSIKTSIERAVSENYTNITNPYGDGKTSERIIKILKKIDNPNTLLHKHFFEYD